MITGDFTGGFEIIFVHFCCIASDSDSVRKSDGPTGWDLSNKFVCPQLDWWCSPVIDYTAR